MVCDINSPKLICALNTTLSDTILSKGLWFSGVTEIPSTNKIDHHDITETLLIITPIILLSNISNISSLRHIYSIGDDNSNSFVRQHIEYHTGNLRYLIYCPYTDIYIFITLKFLCRHSEVLYRTFIFVLYTGMVMIKFHRLTRYLQMKI